ncbi:hypothetical protein ES703_67300 [subsurface metagenome]
MSASVTVRTIIIYQAVIMSNLMDRNGTSYIEVGKGRHRKKAGPVTATDRYTSRLKKLITKEHHGHVNLLTVILVVFIKQWSHACVRRLQNL